MTDERSVHISRWPDISQPASGEALFKGLLLNMRLATPDAIPPSELDDASIEMELNVREAIIKDYSTQMGRLHEEKRRRQEGA